MEENKIQTLEISMAELKKDIDYIKKGQEKNDEQHDQILSKIDEITEQMNSFIKGCDDHFVIKADHREAMRQMGIVVSNLDDKVGNLNDVFAPKIVWNIMCWVGGTAGAVMISGGLYFLARAFLHIGN